MATGKIRGIASLVALLCTLAVAAGAQAENTSQPGQEDYRNAAFVQVTLGVPSTEAGLRLVGGQADGQTEPLGEGGGHRSVPGPAGADRLFYFDVHDSYVHGGLNKVIMTVTYLDSGLTPVYLEYDSFDTLRPDSKADAVTRKRIPLVTRSNSDAWRTERITLDDARFAGSQPGGADFRIGSGDELVIKNVSVLRVSHQNPQPSIRVNLDGKEVTFDVVPFIDPATNRTLVPMRAMFNALGIPDSNIYWDGTARRVEARKGQTSIALTIERDVAFVNGIPVKLDQPAVIKADRTLVPLRFVSEQFGLKVEWNQAQQVITLTSSPPPFP